MNLTHEEAQQMACCSYNQNCQGKHCMAWRWHRVVTEVRVSKEMGGRYSLIPMPIYVNTDRGHCGLVKD